MSENIDNKYQNGKIYKIWDNGFNKCYIGSTVQELSKRMAGHRNDYQCWITGSSKQFKTSFSLFEEFGIENCKIELLESYPCNSKDELFAREGHHQREHECINKRIECRTRKEYREDHKDDMRQYRQDNKERINECHTIYRKKHKEQIAATNKKSYEKNIEKRRQYYQETRDIKLEMAKAWRLENKDKLSAEIICECGSKVQYENKWRHEKTKKHKQYMMQLT